MGSKEGRPRQSLGVFDVGAIIVGLVVGAGIFKAPAAVAANTGSEIVLILSWILGGLISIVGALCYAELAASYPHAGGEYHFLHRAYGKNVSFVFGWSRMVVLQTGSIALLAFVLGDYAAQLFPMDDHMPALVAGLAVVVLTALNLAGLHWSKSLQNLLTMLTLGGLLLVIAAGLFATPADVAAPAQTQPQEGRAFGLAMVFVLLTYGGWNEAAYVSAELRDVNRNMWKVLLGGLGLVTVIYLLVNLAYLRVLGMALLARSDAVTADLMRLTLGHAGAMFVSVLIIVAVLASINVTILTGARTNYALGKDFRLFDFLGHWSFDRNAPTRALLLQGAISLLLVIAGSASRSGFEAMVSYISPVFWLFFMLTTLSLIVLRWRDPQRKRPFRVPGYPWTPLLFAGICAYMFYSSLAYSGTGAFAGVALLGVGLLLSLFRGA